LSCDALLPEQYVKVLRGYCDEVERTGQLPFDALRDYPSMLFGLETALYTLHSTLFDTPFTRGEVGIPINGLVWMGTYEEMSRRIEQKLAQGFHCVKLKIGAINFDDELALLKQIRQRFGPSDVELRVDANGAFAPDEALGKLEQLSHYALHSIEQPIRAGQWEQMAELCRQSPLPIALDEELIGINAPDRKRELLDTICPAYIILKPSLHGGMAGCREWIAEAHDRAIGSWITSALESNVGLNAIAQFCSDVYGEQITMPQGLGTGQLFTDNIDMGLEIRGDKLWRVKNCALSIKH
jgi:L-alanine-DL-glutamate epimerase-like enolase superfamily enzyme